MASLENEKLIWAYVRVNPYSETRHVRTQLVHVDKRLSSEEFDKARKKLIRKGWLFEPRPGRLSVTSNTPPPAFGHTGSVETTAVKLKFPKRRTRKAKAVIVKRKYIQGYKCRRCGFFIDRPWSKAKIRKCPKCNRQTYYGKPILVKSERKKEWLTKKGKQLREKAKETRWKIKMPKLSDLGIKLDQVIAAHLDKFDAQKQIETFRAKGDDRPYRIVQAYDPNARKTFWHVVYDPSLPKVELPKPRSRGRPRVHLKREEYKGSAKAKEAARKSWATRRRRAKERVLVGFYKEDGKTKPITKAVGELNRKKIVKRTRTFRGIKPKGKRSDARKRISQLEARDMKISKRINKLEKKMFTARRSKANSIYREIKSLQSQRKAVARQIDTILDKLPPEERKKIVREQFAASRVVVESSLSGN